MTLTKKHTFIFSEPVKPFAKGNFPFTTISPAYIVMIENSFYRVLDESKQAGTHRPQPFQLREKDKVVQGWKFDAQEITSKETIKLLKEHKIPCLVLNPKNVKR